MAVVLPSNFDMSLITLTSVRYYPHKRGGWFHHVYPNFPVPPKALYYVNLNESFESMALKCDGDNTVFIKMHIPTGFPSCDYIINQYVDDEIIPGLNEYPSGIKNMVDYLNKPLPMYGKPRYEVLRAYNYLEYMFGTVDKELLSVSFPLLSHVVKNCVSKSLTQDEVKLKLLGESDSLTQTADRNKPATEIIELKRELEAANARIAELSREVDRMTEERDNMARALKVVLNKC